MNDHPQSRLVDTLRAVCLPILVALVGAANLGQVFSQTPSAWSGQVQCQLDDQDQSYSRHETQTWTLTGGGPISPNGMPAYNATWSVSGQGQLQRIQGGQTTNIQWSTSVPSTPATIAIFVRSSDNRLIIKPWHSQLRADYAVTGARQVTVNGAAQPTSNFSHSVWEWQLPRIEANPTDTNVSGSTQSPAEVGDAELLHHFGGGMPPMAVCQWAFTRGGATSTSTGLPGSALPTSNPQSPQTGNSGFQNNGQNCESPTTVQQTFEAMKANLQAQFNQLTQGTSDPSQISSLTSQEQRLLANLNAQEQHDMMSASQGCVQSAGGQGSNPNVGGSPGANGPGTNSNPSAGGGPSAGGQGTSSNPGGAGSTGSKADGGSNPGGGGGPSAGGQGTGSNPGGAGSTGSKADAGSAPGGGGNPDGTTGQPTSPQLLSLSPNTVCQGCNVSVHLTGQGTHWQTQGTNLSFGQQVTVQSFTADPNGTSAAATINVAINAAAGSRAVMLMTGTEMVGLPGGLTITAAPTPQGSGSSGSPKSTGVGSSAQSQPTISLGMLSGVSPATNNGQQSVTVTLTGQRTNFVNGQTAVNFVRAPQPGSTNALFAKSSVVATALNSASTPPPLQVVSVKVTSSTAATATLNIDPTAAAGTYNITVTTPGSNGTETVSLNSAFTVTTTPVLTGLTMTPVTAPPMNVSSTTPASSAPTSGAYRVTITGLMCNRGITNRRR